MFLNTLLGEWTFAFIFNFILIAFVQRFPLLTKSGWIHSAILGTVLYGCLGWNGWFSVVIYLVLGSAVTKIGFAYKKSKGISEGRDGRRGPENVWGSAATGTFMAILLQLLNGYGQYYIFIGFAASFTAKLADTFGSEIGKRWGQRTYLITDFRSVPAGTDGAVSLVGTFASLLGSFLMAFVMFSLAFLPTAKVFFIVALSGFIATVFESLFGALFQARLKWMTNEIVNFFQTSFSCLFAMTLALIFQ